MSAEFPTEERNVRRCAGFFPFVIVMFLAPSLAAAKDGAENKAVLTKAVLRDKIQGGWAGKTIGCTYGGPTEFRFQSAFIQDYQPLPWSAAAIADAFRVTPGLYDDVYMNLTFVDVIEKLGPDAPAEALAKAFAQAPYPLWHANQMARSNILRGIGPPASGHWQNNPHADDIDFQIEADFAGLMSPGLPAAAAALCDRVGHIMNYGDGWYGGLYVATILSLAFVSDDIPGIAQEALEAIPPESGFARAVREVIDRWRADPADWKAAWFAVERRFGADVGCPEGVFSAFNIEAKINAAWVLVGLLYGRGDFETTMSVAARCGDDSDCNPATAAGILGVVLGYSRIPDRWKAGLAALEDKPFPYVDLSLRQAVECSFSQALAAVKKCGGQTDGESIVIPVETPPRQKLEVAFEGHRPVERRPINADLTGEFGFEFDGVGFALGGTAHAPDAPGYRFRLEMAIDGNAGETIELPADFHDRRETPFWKYALAPGRHSVALRLFNPAEKAAVHLDDLIVYDRSGAGKN